MSTFKLLVSVTIVLSIAAWWYNVCLKQHTQNMRIDLHNYYVHLMDINPYNSRIVPVYDNDCYIIDLNYEE